MPFALWLSLSLCLSHVEALIYGASSVTLVPLPALALSLSLSVCRSLEPCCLGPSVKLALKRLPLYGRARKTKAKQSLTHFPLNAYLISAKYP